MQADEPCASGAPSAPGAPSGPRAPETEREPGPELRLSSQLLPELYAFVARVLFYLAPVYLAGYLGLSITWLLLGAGLWMWWRRNRRGKLGRLAAAFEFLDNERHFISRELLGQHLPAWVSRPRRGGGPSGLGEQVESAGELGRAHPFPMRRSSSPQLRSGCGVAAEKLALGFGLKAWEKSHGQATPRRKTRASVWDSALSLEGSRRLFFHMPVDSERGRGERGARCVRRSPGWVLQAEGGRAARSRASRPVGLGGKFWGLLHNSVWDGVRWG